MPSAFKQLGVTGRSQWGDSLLVESDPALRGLNGIRKYDEMRRTDPTAAAMYLTLSLMVRKVSWHCEAGGEEDVDREAAEFAWSAFNDMSLSFSDLISDVCLMFPFGWAYFEMVLKRRRPSQSKFDDGRVGYRKIALRPQQTLNRWQYDTDGDLLGMWQNRLDGAPVLIPLERSVLFRTSREGDDPEGVSIYRPAVRPWQYKRRLEQVEGIGLYRRWAGFPRVTLPETATTRTEDGEDSDEAKAEGLVENIYNDKLMGAVMPSGWDLDLGGPEGNVDTTMSNTIMRKDSEMARAILAQFLLLGLRSVGTQALAETLLDAFVLSVEAYLDNIAGQFNRHAIPYLFRYNDFPGLTALPELRHSSPRSLDLTQIAQYIGTLTSARLLTSDMRTEAFLRSLIPGMPEPPEEALERPEPVQDEEEVAEEEEPQAAHYFPGNNLLHFADGQHPPPAQRPKEYEALAEENASAQRENIETWTAETAETVADLGEDATATQVRETLDDLILAGLLLFREKSLLDIAAAFWMGFGKPSGGPEQLMALQQEIQLADSWIGYETGGELRRENPEGRPSLFGDIAGTLEGRIAAIMLLLKQDRREEVIFEVTEAVKAATQSYSRAELYAGHVWRGIWSGIYQRRQYDQEDGAVRWEWDPLAEHCPTCLRFGDRTYPSMSAMLSTTGGTLPGYGTECDGRCRCHLEEEVNGRWVWL
jgi:hypothetical protein